VIKHELMKIFSGLLLYTIQHSVVN